MLNLFRCRLKENVRLEDFAPLNQWIDEELTPAYMRIEGVNSVQAYNSTLGDVVFLIDLDDYATQDRLLADTKFASAAGKWFEYFTKTSDEYLLDRPALQQFLTPS